MRWGFHTLGYRAFEERLDKIGRVSFQEFVSPLVPEIIRTDRRAKLRGERDKRLTFG
jgi:hypothetical protein